MPVEMDKDVEGGREQTNGEYIVGIAFNPSNSPDVDRIKRLAADLIDAIDKIPLYYEAPGRATSVRQAEQRSRLQELAVNHVETGVMFAVKAATKPR